VELYNTTDHDLNVGGLYLSDDYTVPTKWQFPEGTIIGTDAYLLIWADEDLSQEGLHANFKLSAGGERIMLSDESLVVIDSTSYGAQTTNHSMARIPNGSGALVDCRTPTPGAFNSEPPSSTEAGSTNLIGLRQNVPNPCTGITLIEFNLSRGGPVTLQIFDLQGRRIATVFEGRSRRGCIACATTSVASRPGSISVA